MPKNEILSHTYKPCSLEHPAQCAKVRHKEKTESILSKMLSVFSRYQLVTDVGIRCFFTAKLCQRSITMRLV